MSYSVAPSGQAANATAAAAPPAALNGTAASDASSNATTTSANTTTARASTSSPAYASPASSPSSSYSSSSYVPSYSPPSSWSPSSWSPSPSWSPRTGGAPERHESIWHCHPIDIWTRQKIGCDISPRGPSTCQLQDGCPSWCTTALCLSPAPHACLSAGSSGGGGPGSDGPGGGGPGGRRYGPGYAPLLTPPLPKYCFKVSLAAVTIALEKR